MKNEQLHEVGNSRDFKQLNEILQELIGQPILKLELADAGELAVHFGSRRPYEHAAVPGDFRGSWMLMTCASGWSIIEIHPPSFLISGQPDEELVPALAEISARMAAITVEKAFTGAPQTSDKGEVGPILHVHLRKGTHIAITPTFQRDDAELADWELFTPLGMCLSAGPGAVWSCLAEGVE